MKRIASIIILVMLLCGIVTSLAGCFVVPSGNSNQNNQNTNQTNSIGVRFSDTEGWSQFDFVTAISREMKKSCLVLKASDTHNGLQINVGRVAGQSVCESAYTALGRYYSGNWENSVWLIYSTGNEICIAYDNAISRAVAIEYFLNNCLDESILTKKGVIVCDEFATLDYVVERRAETRKEDFASFEQSLGKDAAAELEKLYTLFDEDMYIWLANLWDPDIGGFYYSASGRDTVGYLPDIESTAQALVFLEYSGMLEEYNNSYAQALSEEMKSSILAFAKSLQSEKDGYFYHEQWGEDITTSRKGRDLGWATRIIKKLGGVPYYDTPNGMTGENRIGQTASFSSSDVSAVSHIVLTASALPSYLTNPTEWKNYLENLWLTKNSYSAGNTLDALTGQIGRASQQIQDILHEFLDEKQYASTGLWESAVTYDGVNGLMKICGVYTNFGWTIPHAERALESAIEIALKPDGAVHVCSVYNPWVAMYDLIESIRKSEGKAVAEQLRAGVRERAAELISATYEKIKPFKKDDGGFSYYKNYTNATSQGANVAVHNTCESDVNSTEISCNGITRYITMTLGVDRVYPFCDEDFQYFKTVIGRLSTIVKDDIPAASRVTFDDFVATDDEKRMEFVEYPHYTAISYVGDREFDLDGTYKWFSTAIVPNPTKSQSTSDLVFKGQSFIEPDEDKVRADAGSSIYFYLVNSSAQGDTYVFDADIYFENASNGGVVAQLFFGNDDSQMASLNLSTYTENGTQYLRIGENYAGVDGIKNDALGGNIKSGEWNNIRVELYKIYDFVETSTETKRVLSIKMKLFINGVYQGECDAGHASTTTNTYYDRRVTRIGIGFYRYSKLTMYLNNVYASKSNEKYVASENPNAIAQGTIPNEEMREKTDFEDGLLNTSNVQNKKSFAIYGLSSFATALEGVQNYNPYILYSLANDPTGVANRVLRVQVTEGAATASRTEVHLTNPSDEGYTYVFSGRFYYDSIENNTDITQFTLKNSDDKIIFALRLIPYNGTNGKELKLVEYNNQEGGTGTGKTLCSGIPTGQWFEMRIEFVGTNGYEDITDLTGSTTTVNNSTLTTNIYINGVLKATDTTYRRNNFPKKEITYFGISHQRAHDQVTYLDDLSLVKEKQD